MSRNQTREYFARRLERMKLVRDALLTLSPRLPEATPEEQLILLANLAKLVTSPPKD